ncbi:hypothetical protein IGG08_001168 [Escherichia coli]|nr:hypothetical protein [Escherichia coli]
MRHRNLGKHNAEESAAVATPVTSHRLNARAARTEYRRYSRDYFAHV